VINAWSNVEFVWGKFATGTAIFGPGQTLGAWLSDAYTVASPYLVSPVSQLGLLLFSLGWIAIGARDAQANRASDSLGSASDSLTESRRNIEQTVYDQRVAKAHDRERRKEILNHLGVMGFEAEALLGHLANSSIDEAVLERWVETTAAYVGDNISTKERDWFLECTKGTQKQRLTCYLERLVGITRRYKEFLIYGLPSS